MHPLLWLLAFGAPTAASARRLNGGAQGSQTQGVRTEFLEQIDRAVKNVTVIVPVMNRAKQVKGLIPHLMTSMADQKLFARVFVVEQVESYRGNNTKPDAFNKGRLLNAAIDALGARAGEVLIFNDADVWETCPGTIRYRYCADNQPHVYHLFGYPSGSVSPVPGGHTLGGIFCISADMYRSVNGYSNDFTGWGHEDNDFGGRIRKANGTVLEEGAVTRESDHFNDCVHDEISKGIWNDDPRDMKHLVGTTTTGLKDVSYVWEGETKILSTDSGTVTILRVSLPAVPTPKEPRPLCRHSSKSGMDVEDLLGTVESIENEWGVTGREAREEAAAAAPAAAPAAPAAAAPLAPLSLDAIDLQLNRGFITQAEARSLSRAAMGLSPL
jgi:hypothetical protein